MPSDERIRALSMEAYYAAMDSDGCASGIEAVIRKCLAEQRKEDAKICDEMLVGGHDGIDDLAEELIHLDCAAAIRAQGKP